MKPISDEERLAHLIRVGKVLPALSPRSMEWEPPLPIAPGEKSPLQYLLEERYGEDAH